MAATDLDTKDLFNGKYLTSQPAMLSVDQLVPVAPSQKIIIDWRRKIKLRPWVLQHDHELSYLLLPEINLLLAQALDETELFLFATLWRTGARISEVLALTPASFIDDVDVGRLVSIPTAKKRPSAVAKVGRPQQQYRILPLDDDKYWSQLRLFLGSHKGGVNAPLFQSNRSSKGKMVRRSITPKTAHNWIVRAANKMREQYDPQVSISAHTFRHSFAVNAVLHGRDLTAIRDWLGHANVKETERYIKVLASDSGHLMKGVEFW